MLVCLEEGSRFLGLDGGAVSPVVVGLVEGSSFLDLMGVVLSLALVSFGEGPRPSGLEGRAASPVLGSTLGIIGWGSIPCVGWLGIEGPDPWAWRVRRHPLFWSAW